MLPMDRQQCISFSTSCSWCTSDKCQLGQGEKDHLLPSSPESWWLVRRGWIKEGRVRRKTSEVLHQVGGRYSSPLISSGSSQERIEEICKKKKKRNLRLKRHRFALLIFFFFFPSLQYQLFLVPRETNRVLFRGKGVVADPGKQRGMFTASPRSRSETRRGEGFNV